MSVSLKDEVRDAALGDQRLTKRLGKVIEQLGALGQTIRQAGAAPKYIVCDRDSIFDCDAFLSCYRSFDGPAQRNPNA